MLNLIYKNSLKLSAALFFCCVLLVSSCNKDEPEVTEDPDAVKLLSFGPSPALRLGEIKFIGKNLDKVTSVVLPSNVNVTNFITHTATLIELTVPVETVDGLVTLKTTDGDITSLSPLTISEPIFITSFSPSQARPGDEITITGSYLNLIKEVVFADKQSVTSFVSQTQTEIKVLVPDAAKSGVITISNGEEEPIVVESDEVLAISLPTLTSVSPTPVKAGGQITIEGADLDLVTSITFPGGGFVETFVSHEPTKIVAEVPVNGQDGPIEASVASFEVVTSEQEVVMVVPTISGITPATAKNGKIITIRGTDLDLVTTVIFGGDVEGEITSAEPEVLKVRVPLTAIDGVVTLNTASTKQVISAEALPLAVPSISGISPETGGANSDIQISGFNLDLVTSVRFAGDLTVSPISTSSLFVDVTVPTGALSGPVTVITDNGTEVTSTVEFVVEASNVPIITNMPASVKPGEILVIEGEKLDLFSDVIFPGDVKATQFGIKTESMMEVVVPLDVQKGLGVITFVTIDNELTTSPEINIQGVDPVVDTDLVFFDFNGDGKDSWWGNVVLTNDANSVDGSQYGVIDGNYDGWTDLFWRNDNNNFPGASVGTNVNDYVLKFDINVLEPLTGGNLKFRLNSSENDFWWALGPDQPNGGDVIETTGGWVTMTIPISDFKDDNGWGSLSPTDLTDVPNEFGMAFNDGASIVKFYIDNVRFELK